MHKNNFYLKNYNYQQEEGQSAKKISENNPYYQNKYDSYTPRKRYIKEHEDYDGYRMSHLEKNSSKRESSPYKKEEECLRTSRVKKNSNGGKQEQHKYDPAPQYSQRIVQKYSKELYDFDENEILKENTQKYVNKTTSRKQKLKGFAIDKDICKNLYLEDEEITEKSTINWAPKNRREVVEKKKSYQVEVDQNVCLTPRRMSKMSQNKNNNQFYEKMSNLQQKISRLQKMTPKRSSTPKNSRITETSNYNNPNYNNPNPYNNPNSNPYNQKPLNFTFNTQSKIPIPSPPPPQLYLDRQQYDIPLTSRSSAVSQRQIQIMSRVSLGRLVEQQQAQTQVQMIQELSNKISSKLQSIIRNFG